jgi:hypothetical protein
MAVVPELSLPRSQWTEHPNWPSQVLLLRSHQAFRETSRVLCRRARDGGDSAAIGWIFNAWKSGMHSHERYEEYKCLVPPRSTGGVS